MADPQLIESLPDGVKWAPTVLDDVPADFEAMYDAGTPYVAIVAPSDADPSVPKLVYVLGSSTGGATLPAGVAGALMAYDGTDWIAADILTDAVSGDVILIPA
jgi:hypothetical protein